MIFSMLSLTFTFKDPNLTENLIKFGGYSNKLDPVGFMGLAFYNSMDP